MFFWLHNILYQLVKLTSSIIKLLTLMFFVNLVIAYQWIVIVLTNYFDFDNFKYAKGALLM